MLAATRRATVVSLLFVVIAGPWRGAASSGARPFQDVRMIDVSRGWALTNQCLLHTEDGGVHWRNVTPPKMNPGARPRPRAFYLAALMAWIVTSSPAPAGGGMTAPAAVFRTADGGRTWRSGTLETGDVFQITFVSPSAGWLIAFLNGGMMSDLVEIFRSVDAGATWAKVASAGDETMPPGTPSSGLPRGGKKFGIGFADTTTGWVVGYTPRPSTVYLYVTRDGGRHWHAQDLPRVPGLRVEEFMTQPPVFFSGRRGILPVRVLRREDSGTVVYVTQDGGATWRPTSRTPATAYGRGEAGDFLDTDHWWIIGDAGLVATKDGGHRWQPRTRPDLGDDGGVTFATPDTGWAFSRTRPSLFRTGDGGRRWDPVSYTVAPICAR